MELQCDTNMRLFAEENEVGSPFVLLSGSARNNKLNYTSSLQLANMSVYLSHSSIADVKLVMTNFIPKILR